MTPLQLSAADARRLLGKGKTRKRRAAHTWGVMNATEAAYAQRLAIARTVAPGQMGEALFEAFTLRLGPGLSYTPDFYVPIEVGKPEIHEVKGPYAREDAKVKFRAAVGARANVFAFYLAELIDGTWHVERWPRQDEKEKA